MRWASWALGIAGVLQYAVIAYLQPADYVSTDMAYLVMWLAVGGGLLLCALSYGGCCCDDDACGCCGDGCACGDCADCMPNGNGHAHHEGHEGHTH